MARLGGRTVSSKDIEFEADHLDGCERCRVEAEAYEQLRYTGEHGPIPKADDFSRARAINEAIGRFDAEGAVKPRLTAPPRRLRARMVSAGVAMVGLFVVGLLLWRYSAREPDAGSHEMPAVPAVPDGNEGPARLLMVSGAVERAGSVARMDDRVEVGQEIRAEQGAFALGIGTDDALLVAPHTTIVLRSYSSTMVGVDLKGGRIFGRIVQGGQQRRLVVHAPGGRAVITGTVFSVHVDGKEAEVSVLHGTVAVESDRHGRVELDRRMSRVIGEVGTHAISPSEMASLRGAARRLEMITRARQGSIYVASRPEGAPVKVDGVLLGVTPVDARIPAGEHELMVGDRGHVPIREFLSVEQGMRYMRSYELHSVESAPVDPRFPADRTQPPEDTRRKRTGSREPPENKPASGNPPSLETLLKEAHHRLARRNWRGAVKTYLRIRKNHPSSGAALSSLVSLGSLYLDRLGRPAAALRYFNKYLSRKKDGTLAQEAAFGRLRALRRLGRKAKETAGLRSFLRKYPGAVQARQVRRRLNALTAKRKDGEGATEGGRR
jgi:ferric-dicitrate binding protein FerR (iron transport regulator)